MSCPVIEARQLRAGYGKVMIVRDVNLHVMPGEVVALVGLNGAGKTTTVLTLAGELPPLGGEVWWHGEATSSPLHIRARQGLALVTEKRAVLLQLTVAENRRVIRSDPEPALNLFTERAPHAARQAGRLLSSLGDLLVGLGRRLERYEVLPVAASPDLQMACEAETC